MLMFLFFSIIGVMFYKLFLKSPYEQKQVVKSNKSIATSKKAADSNA